MDLQSYVDDFFLLLEAGFIAVNQADEDSSLKLFKAAEMLKPQNLMPTIGMGYLHLHKLELKQAVERFEKVLKKEPDNQLAKTFLGLCLVFSPNAVEKGEEILEEAGKSDDKLVQDLSKTALHFVDQFIKKDPTPVENPQGKNKSS